MASGNGIASRGANGGIYHENTLVNAVVAQLPPIGQAFTSAMRVRWLRMMAMALDVAYGAEREIECRLKPLDDDELPNPIERRPAAAVAPAPLEKLPAHVLAGADYYVDAEGLAKRDPGGARIDADDVPEGEVIYDHRTGPARDRSTIVWADGSTGARPGMSFCGPG